MSQKQEERLTVIKPKNRFFSFNLKEIWEYKDLVFIFAKRNLSVKYKQTVLGPAWLVITPIVSALVSSFVFGTIAKIESGAAPYFAFYFSAFVAWSYFATCLSSTASTFSANALLFHKVYFPRLIVPLSNVLSALFRFAVHFVLMVVILVIYSLCGAAIEPIWEMVWLLPLLVVEMALLALGCGAILSALTAKFRDLTKLITLGIDVWKYLTPVVYAASALSGAYRVMVLVNPMGPVIEAFRYIILGSGGEIYPLYLLCGLAETLVICFFGLLIFHRVERTFVDTV